MELRLRFEDSGYETVEVSETNPERFQLETTPVLAPVPVYLGDLIEATEQADGTHRFVRVVAPAPMRHASWVVPRSFVESADYRAFNEAVHAAGGKVECVMGGVLYAHVPESSSFDASAELGRYLSSDWPEA